MPDSVLVEVDGPVLVLTLNRPEVHNAVDLGVCEGIAEGIRRLEEDPTLRVGVVTGTGSTFCSGVDLRAAEAGDSMAISEFDPGGFAGFVGLERTKPVIGAAQGHALAGGLEILLACELPVGSSTARFGLPEVRIGIMAAAGGTIALGRDYPFASVMRMLLTGTPIDAAEALRIGMLAEVVEPDRVLARAREIAAEISEAAPLAVQASMRLARLARAGVDQARLAEANRAEIDTLLASSDAAEGRRSFLQRRAPHWSGH